MAQPTTRSDGPVKSSVINTIPLQPQKGTWLTFGVRSVSILTGAAMGAKGGKSVASIYTGRIIAKSCYGNGRAAVMLAVSLANVVVGGIALGATGGALAGNCVANRVLARTGLNISS